MINIRDITIKESYDNVVFNDVYIYIINNNIFINNIINLY